MKWNRVSLVLFVLVSFLAVLAVYGQPPSDFEAQPGSELSAADVAPSSAVAPPSQAEEFLRFAAADKGAKGKGGGLSPSNSPNAIASCEWFWIECYDGYSDECCGSLFSCWDYCEEVCGGPCEYIPN